MEYYYKKNGEPLLIPKEKIWDNIDVLKEETFLFILKELDYPWLPTYWFTIVRRESEKDAFTTSLAQRVLNKYLAQTDLIGFKSWRWADTFDLIEKMASKRPLWTMLKSLEPGEIFEVVGGKKYIVAADGNIQGYAEGVPFKIKEVNEDEIQEEV